MSERNPSLPAPPPDEVLPCPVCGFDLRAHVEKFGYEGVASGARCPECSTSSDLWSIHNAAESRFDLHRAVFGWQMGAALLTLPALIAIMARLILGQGVLGTTFLILLHLGAAVYLYILAITIAQRSDLDDPQQGWFAFSLWALACAWNILWFTALAPG